MVGQYAHDHKDEAGAYLDHVKGAVWLGLFLLISGTYGLSADIYSVASSGYYDEPSQANTVDFEAAGSTLHYADMTQAVRVAYCNGFAGVYQCERIAFSSYVALDYALDNWGSHRKVILLNIDSIGMASRQAALDWVPISGETFCLNSSGGMYFEFGEIFYGDPGEQLVALGLTILSRRSTNYGRVVAVARFTDGTTASASREINEDRGLGDTFFGFRAPLGAGITRVDISSETGVWIGYDDLVFFTAAPHGVPRLKIRPLAANQLEISWAATCNSYVLESASFLGWAEWVPVTNSVDVAREQFSVTVPIAGTTKAFRLHLAAD